MDEQLRIILIIIVSVSIFGLLVFVFVRNYIKSKIDHLVQKEKEEFYQLENVAVNDKEITSIDVFRRKRKTRTTFRAIIRNVPKES